jgi:hypothetical protein
MRRMYRNARKCRLIASISPLKILKFVRRDAIAYSSRCAVCELALSIAYAYKDIDETIHPNSSPVAHNCSITLLEQFAARVSTCLPQ